MAGFGWCAQLSAGITWRVWPGRKNCLQGVASGCKPKPMTPVVDRTQFVTQILFNFSAAVVPQLVQRREFSELKDFNAELVEAADDLYERYKTLLGETVSLTVASGSVAQFPNPGMTNRR